MKSKFIAVALGNIAHRFAGGFAANDFDFAGLVSSVNDVRYASS